MTRCLDAAAPAGDIRLDDHLGLVFSITLRFADQYSRYGRRIDAGDLVGVGWMALKRAAEKFNPALGFAFSTYACRAIWMACMRWYETEHRPELRSPRRRALGAMRSLDAPVGRRDGRIIERHETIAARPAHHPLMERYAAMEELAAVCEIDTLSDTERQYLGLRGRGLTRPHLMAVMGVKRHSADHIRASAAMKIRQAQEAGETT